MKKTLKKIIIFLIAILAICVLGCILIYNSAIHTVDFSNQKNISINRIILNLRNTLFTSKEYKELYDLSKLEFYKENHLLVQEVGELYCDTHDYHFDNKYIDSVMYCINDDNDLVKAMVCRDNDLNMTYAMYQYKDKTYVKYNNYSDKIYSLYNFSQKGLSSTDSNAPDFTMYENYKPQFIGRYYNVSGDDDNAYMELYELSFVNDTYYKNALKDYFKLDEKGFLKVYVNNMKLVSAVGISKGENEDCIIGPYNYQYYYDKNYDVSALYEYVKNSGNFINITLVDVDKDKTIDTISIDSENILMIDYGDVVEGIYIEKECKNEYKNIMHDELRGTDQSKINENGDFTLYVKYK